MNPTGGILRSLSPMLGQLEMNLRAWVERAHVQPLGIIARSTLDGLTGDLARKAADLGREQPFLTVMLMGGTGVGKSTLLNALAGHVIAPAAATRPTTRDCVVYHHKLLPPERFDPALRGCRLVAHERDDLLWKVLVDTPDLDSNETANRARLEAVLPVADVVLYVGSQEKYHDGIAWSVFRQQRQRRAFAFVLNKWDRCLHSSNATGTRPDTDLLRDLDAEGFHAPRLFRTAAHLHQNGLHADVPVGEQFADLAEWLEHGLSRLEIEALKARGVLQLLEACRAGVDEAMPPDLTASLSKTGIAWDKALSVEAAEFTAALVQTLDPNAHEIEYHFSTAGQRRFTRLMAAYLGAMTQLQQAGTRLRERLPFLGNTPAHLAVKHSWDLAGFTHECIRVASERSLEPRSVALANRLTVEANDNGFPAALLPEQLGAVARHNWRAEYEHAVNEAFAFVQKQTAAPTGTRRWLHAVVIGAANILPEVALLSSLLLLLWRYFVRAYQPTLFDFAVPFLVTFAVLVLLHMVVQWLLPLRWPAIRAEFRRQLERRVRQLLLDQYLPIPGRVAALLEGERRELQVVRGEVDDVEGWLAARHKAANIEQLYGGPAQRLS